MQHVRDSAESGKRDQSSRPEHGAGNLSGKGGRGLAKDRDKDQLCTFPLPLQQDELVLVK